METEKRDLLIIGSGQGAVPLAAEFAQNRKRVVLFERERLGGSCVNWGCTPAKAFLGAAHAAGRARLAGSLGVACDVRIDFETVMSRTRGIRDRFNQGVKKKLTADGVEIVHAEASFREDGTVQADGRTFSAPVIVIDTGTRPAVPPVKGLEQTPYLTDHNVWDLTQLPPQLAVIGGGYIGLELGQAFARLGSEVGIFEHGARVLASESEDVSDVLRQALERDGVAVHENTGIDSVAYDGSGCRLKAGDKEYFADSLLVATGRTPNTDALNAAQAGIALDKRGYIEINDYFEAGPDGVYAIGEAAGQPAFTHVAWEDYRRLKAVLEGNPRRRDDRVLAYAAFTEPQVARAGLSAQQAQANGYRVRRARMEVRDMARGIEWGHDLGFYRLIFDGDSNRLLGAELVGYEVSELVHVLLDLMETGVTAAQLERWQHVHPTYAENLPTLARMITG